MTATDTTAGTDQRPLVVIVDDDPLNNMVCRKYIELVKNPDEQTIITFTDPTKALEFVCDAVRSTRSNTPVRIFLDLNMPVMSGWDFLDAIDLLSPKAKSLVSIFIVSSSLDTHDRRRAEDNPNVRDFIVKPLTRTLVQYMMN